MQPGLSHEQKQGHSDHGQHKGEDADRERTTNNELKNGELFGERVDEVKLEGQAMIKFRQSMFQVLFVRMPFLFLFPYFGDSGNDFRKCRSHNLEEEFHDGPGNRHAPAYPFVSCNRSS